MLNRNATGHLLLIASILLCAFIYAGYSLATRGEADPADAPAAKAENTVSGLRPSGAEPGDAAALLIPPANGDDLPLTPPAAQSMRPPPAALSQDAEIISGLVPDASAEEADADAPDSSGSLMPGATLALPGFSAPSDTPEGSEESSSPPVLTLPGMSGAGDAAIASGDEDFGEAALGGDEGDFAALPGFDAPAEESPATTTTTPAVLPPPPGAGTAAPAPAPRAATPAPPPPAPQTAGTGLRAPAAETSAVLRPPPPSVPAPRAASASDTGMADWTPSATPPAPARSVPPLPDSGMMEEEEETPEPPRSDSLRIYVVSPGDTLSSIAMRELGSGFLADNIFLLNRDVIDDPDHLMAGVKIRLPYANPGEGGVDAAAPPVPGTGAAPGRRPTQGLGGTHRVVRGDTLSSIALQYYGQSAAWSFLHEANKAIIPNPNQLTVGMELTIPPYGE